VFVDGLKMGDGDRGAWRREEEEEEEEEFFNHCL